MHIKKIGQGKDLVLIHGWGMHSGIWEPIIEKFSNQYTLHLVDIPGMGKSDSIDPYDLNHLAEAISQKLPTSFDILGWSLGGLIALKMSLTHPQKIHRMVLVYWEKMAKVYCNTFMTKKKLKNLIRPGLFIWQR